MATLHACLKCLPYCTGFVSKQSSMHAHMHVHAPTKLGSTKRYAFIQYLKCFWSTIKLNYYTTKYSDLNKGITRRFMSCNMWQCVAGQVVHGVSKECSGSIFRVKQTKPVWAAWPWKNRKCCIYWLQDAASYHIPTQPSPKSNENLKTFIVVPCTILLLSMFFHQLMHKRTALKAVLKFTLKQLHHVSV